MDWIVSEFSQAVTDLFAAAAGGGWSREETWFPLPIQVYVNGHEWLARKLEQNGIRYTKLENTFLWIEDFARAQKFSDRFSSLDWPRFLNRYAQ